MTDRFERKASSSDLLSRLKTRKVLGVGECLGTTTVSKVTQILGQKNETIEDVEVSSLILYWNYGMAFTFLFCGIGIILFGDAYGKEILVSLPGNSGMILNSTTEFKKALEYRIHNISSYFAVAVLSIGTTMLYSLKLYRSGGLRTAQFASGFFSAMLLLVTLTEPDAAACRVYILLGIFLINILCHLYVAFPSWPFWSHLKRRVVNHAAYWPEASSYSMSATTNSGSSSMTPATAGETNVETSPEPSTSTSSELSSNMHTKSHSD